MSAVAVVVSVGTTATRLSSVTEDVFTGHTTLIKVPSAGSTVYLGGLDVTTASGFPLLAGESVSLDLNPDDNLYAVVASGTQTVNVLRAGA